MTVNDVFKWIDAFAPFDTQEDFDNCGLLLGDPQQPVRTILFALDATPAAVDEAARIGADLIVTHHPLMFSPVQQLYYHKGEGPIIRTLMQAGISMIAAHTKPGSGPGRRCRQSCRSTCAAKPGAERGNPVPAHKHAANTGHGRGIAHGD